MSRRWRANIRPWPASCAPSRRRWSAFRKFDSDGWKRGHRDIGDTREPAFDFAAEPIVKVREGVQEGDRHEQGGKGLSLRGRSNPGFAQEAPLQIAVAAKNIEHRYGRV